MASPPQSQAALEKGVFSASPVPAQQVCNVPKNNSRLPAFNPPVIGRTHTGHTCIQDGRPLVPFFSAFHSTRHGKREWLVVGWSEVNWYSRKNKGKVGNGEGGFGFERFEEVYGFKKFNGFRGFREFRGAREV